MRGGPAEFEVRLARVRSISRTPAVAEPLAALEATLVYQSERVASAEVRALAGDLLAAALLGRLGGGRPAFVPGEFAAAAPSEIRAATGALGSSGVLPEPLPQVAAALGGEPDSVLAELTAAWLLDASSVPPPAAFWLRVACAPALESAAAEIGSIARTEWSLPVCPACGGPPQVSVIREESGEFLAGSPRSLICARCALWWAYPRATCTTCGNDTSTQLHSYSDEEHPVARIDMCDSCHGYIKTFDLRRPGGVEVVPLVDDVATLVLDVWAQTQGLARPSPSLAGV